MNNKRLDNMAETGERSASKGILIRELTVTAGDKTLLDKTNAEFKSGRITLVVGPSGVGKSVLLKLIAGILDASERGIQSRGEISVNGDRAKSGKVGVVFQSFALFDELSARKNVEFARDVGCLLYTSPSPRDQRGSRMPSSA